MALGFPPLTKDRYEQRIGPSDYSLKIENVQLSDEDSFECQITPFGLRSQVLTLKQPYNSIFLITLAISYSLYDIASYRIVP